MVLSTSIAVAAMNPPVSFFASYSRRDKNYVKPVVDLLRSGAAQVFVDQESIRPGDRWEMVLESNLENAATLLVFWSKNARRSDWVRHEWTDATKANKRIIPVLLDGTPLPKELSAYQYIDFRHFRKRSVWLVGLASAALLGMASTAYLWVSATTTRSPTRGGRLLESIPVPVLVIALASTLLVILTLVVAIARKRTKARQTKAMAQNIATKVVES